MVVTSLIPAMRQRGRGKALATLRPSGYSQTEARVNVPSDVTGTCFAFPGEYFGITQRRFPVGTET